MSDIVKDFVKALKSEKKTSAYDTTAVVTRVEDDVAWVHIAGGVDETPVRLTINAKAGDSVQVRVSGGRAWLTGNMSAPPTDNEMAQRALDYGKIANDAAQKAVADSQIANEAASSAKRSADEAQRTAESVEGIARHAEEVAEGVEQIARDAETSAGEAKTAADKAMLSLSNVEDVVGVLDWIANHGTMESQAGETFDENNVYFIVDQNGDYVVGSTRYSLVTEPRAEDIDTYYCLSVDKSIQNYVATHIVVDSEGLWIIPDSGGNKMLIATGSGSTYKTAGTYIIGKVNNVDKVLAKFITTGAIVGQIDGAHSVIDEDGMQIYSIDSQGDLVELANIGYGEGRSQTGTGENPYYTFGMRKITDTLYDSRATYAVGDICMYNDLVYVCTETISQPEQWNPNHWKLAIGNWSLAEGYNTTASGAYSHAEGRDTTASGNYSHAEGNSTIASGAGSHAEGSSGGRRDGTPLVIYATTASGDDSHAEGSGTLASGTKSHAEGSGSIASGTVSHAEGYFTIASGGYSHAEGLWTTASETGSHAEGNSTIASGARSHAEGNGTEAEGDYSHTQNFYTVASRKSQTVLGEYNIVDTQGTSKSVRGKYVIIVGNGTADDARSNAFTVDWSGNIVASGDVTDGSGNVLGNKADTTDLADYLPLAGGTMTGTLNGTDIIASGDLQGEDCKLALDTSATSGVDKKIYDALVNLGWDSDVIV